MAGEISYYAIVDDHTSEPRPVGVLRRFEDDSQRDESFGYDLEWKFTSIRHAIEHGDLQYELVPISKEEADGIVSRMEARNASGSGDDLGNFSPGGNKEPDSGEKFPL